MEGEDLLIGIKTMKRWAILPKDFPNNESEKFLKSDKKMKV